MLSKTDFGMTPAKSENTMTNQIRMPSLNWRDEASGMVSALLDALQSVGYKPPMVAEAIGVSERSVWYWKSGEVIPRADEIMALEEFAERVVGGGDDG